MINLSRSRPSFPLSLFLSLSLSVDDTVLDHVRELKVQSAVFLPERATWRVREEEERGMGMGKNITSKSMEGEGAKYEEENKHRADFYPIPVQYTCVRECVCMFSVCMHASVCVSACTGGI